MWPTKWPRIYWIGLGILIRKLLSPFTTISCFLLQILSSLIFLIVRGMIWRAFILPRVQVSLLISDYSLFSLGMYLCTNRPYPVWSVNQKTQISLLSLYLHSLIYRKAVIFYFKENMGVERHLFYIMFLKNWIFHVHLLSNLLSRFYLLRIYEMTMTSGSVLRLVCILSLGIAWM